MQYKVTAVQEKKTQTGKDYKLLTVEDEQGTVSENVSMWADSPAFNLATQGANLAGSVVTKGQWKNFKVEGQTFTRKPGNIAAAQEKKAEYIKEAQDRKEESISYFNSCNLAIEVCKLQGKFDPVAFKKARRFFLNEYSNYKTNPTDTYDAFLSPDQIDEAPDPEAIPF